MKDTIAGHVRDISSVSHLVWHNGSPCDLYTATVRICQVGYTGAGLNSWYLVITAESESQVNAMIEQYRTDGIVFIPTKNLVDKRGNPYGKARN